MKFSNKFKVRCSQIADISPEKKEFTDSTYKVMFNWMKAQPELYGETFSSSIQSKYLTKGIEKENEAIQYVSKKFGYSYWEKNKIRKQNDFIIGECDIDDEFDSEIIDIKCSWDSSTFPLFDSSLKTKRYKYQGIGYCALWDRENYSIIYTLMDTPDYLIEREARKQQYDLGLDEMEEEFYKSIEKKKIFSNFPDYLRIRRFQGKFDGDLYAKIIYKVSLMQDYIENIKESDIFEIVRKI